MLVLTRREGESITILDSNKQKIELTLNKIKNNQAVLGITAPKEICIFRNELLGRDGIRQLFESDEEDHEEANGNLK